MQGTPRPRPGPVPPGLRPYLLTQCLTRNRKKGWSHTPPEHHQGSHTRNPSFGRLRSSRRGSGAGLVQQTGPGWTARPARCQLRASALAGAEWSSMLFCLVASGETHTLRLPFPVGIKPKSSPRAASDLKRETHAVLHLMAGQHRQPSCCFFRRHFGLSQEVGQTWVRVLTPGSHGLHHKSSEGRGTWRLLLPAG